MGKQIKHKGIVTARISDTRYAVKILQQSACASCHAAKLCSAAESREKVIEATSTDNITPGTEVTVYGKTSLGYKALAWAVLIPLIIVLTALPVAVHYSGNELVGGIAALTTLLPYYGVLALMRKRLQQTFVFYIKL